MSTYLVAFVVSDFAFELAPPTGNGVRFRIWARNNAIDQVRTCKFKLYSLPTVNPLFSHIFGQWQTYG